MADEFVTALRREAGRIEEDCNHSARGHYQAARTWSLAHHWIAGAAAVLAALTSGTVIANYPLAATIFALVVTALTAVVTFLNPSQRSHAHHQAGANYNTVRNQARIYHEVELRTEENLDVLAHRLHELAARRDELNQGSPQIPRRAFERGRQSIKLGETSYAVDKSERTE